MFWHSQNFSTQAMGSVATFYPVYYKAQDGSKEQAKIK
jgi:hypothetical protein